MKRCFKCNQEYSETPRFCPKDGQRLFPILLAGRYRLEDKIGEGSMGVVIRASDERFGQKCAIKFLRPEYAADEMARAQFLREAAVAARIKHPHIAAVLDYGIDEISEYAYFMTEYISGASLRQILRQRFQAGGRFAPEEMARVLSQTSKVVEAGHAAGVVHADLKPENIFIQGEAENWLVKVSDFGIAKLKSAHLAVAYASAGVLTGDAPDDTLYLSPEQRAGAPADARSDIYGLGAILYEMALGERLSPSLPPNAKLSGPPKSMEAVILQALERDPRLRQQSASELAHEFEDSVRRSRLSLARNPASNPSFAPVQLNAVRDPRTPSDQTAKWMVRMAVVGGVLLVGSAVFSVIPSVSAPENTVGGNEPLTATQTLASVSPSSPPSAPKGMAYVSGGTFIMGNNASTEPSEKPEHEVLVASFFIDETEVTNAQYAEFLKSVNRPSPPGWKNGVPPVGKENHPVTNVTWEDAKAYATWAGKRLPTEAEWEYAARSADKRLYPWGNEFKPEFANTNERGVKAALPVGMVSGDKSPFGASDMAGNVAEWTATEFAPYPNSEAKPDEGKIIVRGGTFSDPKSFAMTAARSGEPPKAASPNIGFRCAKNLQDR